MISEHPFLKTLSPACLKILAECAERLEFGPGDTIFREGDVAEQFYLIEEGRVALETRSSCGDGRGQQEMAAEAMLGSSWLFPPCPWHFGARAMERTRVLAFDGARLLSLCEREHEFGYELMNRLAQVLIGRLQAVQHQLATLQGPHATA